MKRAKSRVVALISLLAGAVAPAVPLARAGCRGAEVALSAARSSAQRGDLAGAEQAYVAIQGSHPECAEAYFELGVLYDRTQQPAKAAGAFERAVALAPDNPQAWDYLALSLEPLGQFDRAEQAYQKGLAVNRGPLFDSFLDYNYGRFLMKMNRLDEAAAHLDRAVALAPQTRAVYYERAKLHEKRGRWEQARRDAEKAASLADPAGIILDLQVYYQLSRIYSRLGEKELATKYRKLAEMSKVPISSRMRGGR
jgi:tetratricopeptide (TPR) repeat protein